MIRGNREKIAEILFNNICSNMEKNIQLNIQGKAVPIQSNYQHFLAHHGESRYKGIKNFDAFPPKKRNTDIFELRGKSAECTQTDEISKVEMKSDEIQTDDLVRTENCGEIQTEEIQTEDLEFEDMQKQDIKQVEMMSDSSQEQDSSLQFMVSNCPLYKDLTEKEGEEKVIELIKQMDSTHILISLKGKEYFFEPECLLDANEITNLIYIWLKNLHCSYKDCKLQAKCIFKNKDSNQVYCDIHAANENHFAEAVRFEDKIAESKHDLHKLEARLLLVQAKMILFRTEEKTDDSSYVSKLSNLEIKFTELKQTLKSMREKIDQILEKIVSNTKNKEKKSEFKLLNFIQENCKKCFSISLKILSAIFETSLEMQAEMLIQVMNNKKKRIQPHEEAKACQYSKVPNEIYGKSFKIINIPEQSKELNEVFEKKPKENFELKESNQKSVLQLFSNMHEERPYSEGLLSEDQKMYPNKVDKEEEKHSELKELSLRDIHFYADMFEMDYEKLKCDFAKSRGLYKMLGQFCYSNEHPSEDDIHQQFGADMYGRKWLYTGETEKGTDKADGIGICVWSDGGTMLQIHCIYEGYYKDGKKHGKGRVTERILLSFITVI